ncbi:MAG: ParA family protein [Xanthomonadaceae bacterium]|nr:ParA family protein [Xanthomonadaceae bacterium]
MFRILVASAKGGVGKTTISTTLAGAFATQGKATALVDADPQESSRHWCERRGAAGGVAGVDGTRRKWARRVPNGTQRVVIDAAAGAMPKDLEGFLEVADAVLVPVLPTVMDMEATVRFLNALAEHPRVARGALPVGLVANRLRPWTQASQQAIAQLSQWPCELVAQLRDTQAYALMVGLGKCLFDYHSHNVREHQQDWVPLLHWLEHARRGG